MGPVEAFTTAWRKSFDYEGRATRAEFWWFYLMNSLAAVSLALVFFVASFNSTPGLVYPFTSIYFFGQIFPNLSICIRRLRDAGKKWTWIFINLVPFIGGFWFIYLACQPSEQFE